MAATDNILCLCGGVGGAKLAYGLSKVVAAEALLIVVNTGDDFKHLGLHISPDLDSVMYALAEQNDTERGWGLENESWQCMQMLARYGAPTWFNLGDKDLATHLQRTQLLHQAVSLDVITQQLTQAWGIKHTLVPMSNDAVRTIVQTRHARLAMQEYFVKLHCQPVVTSVAFENAEKARIQTDFLQALNRHAAIILCPSNPFLSIDPILALADVRTRIHHTSRPVIAVSPIIQGNAIKGPTAKIMSELNLPVTNTSIAAYYKDIIDYLIIDQADQHDIRAIEKSGVKAITMPTLMQTNKDKIELAENIVQFIADIAT